MFTASPEPHGLTSSTARRLPVDGLAGRMPDLASWPRDVGGVDRDLPAALVRASADGIMVLGTDRRFVYANPAACELLGHPLVELLGRDLITFVPVRDRRTAVAFFSSARRGRLATLPAVAHRTDGSERDVEMTIKKLTVRYRQLVVLVARDVSERRQKAREAAALAQTASLVAGDSIDATVHAIAECAVASTRALAAWVTLDEGGDHAARVCVARLSEDLRQALRDATREPSGTFARPPVAQRVVVHGDARRLLEGEQGAASLAAGLRSLPWQAAASVALAYRGAVVGTLTAIYPEGHLPSEAETTFLATLADQAVLVAASVREVAAAREKVVHEERQRLARELHDSVSQALYGIELEASVARDRLDGGAPRVAQPIEHVLRLVRAGQAEIRALIFELRPESLETEGLVANLNRQIEAVRSRHGTEAQTVGDEPQASLEVKRALYGIAKEAIHNAVKHARARCVGVHLKTDGGTVQAEIADDGVGFDPEGPFPGHLGLQSMRERALSVGGSLEVASSRGDGTRIVVRVPSAVPVGSS